MSGHPATPDVLVVGLGNVLMGDDGFGPTVVRLLEARYELPSRVRVFDAGTPGLDLTFLLQGVATFIAVDAVRAPGAPGRLKVYEKQELLAHPLPMAITPHEPSLKEALWRLEFAGGAPNRASLVGVIPQQTGTGQGLSAAVRGSVEEAIRAVLRELEQAGVVLKRRKAPAPADLWWEAQCA